MKIRNQVLQEMQNCPAVKRLRQEQKSKKNKQDRRSNRLLTSILHMARKTLQQKLSRRQARKIFLQVSRFPEENRHSREQIIHSSRQIPDALHGPTRKYLKAVLLHRSNLQYHNSRVIQDSRFKAARKKCLRLNRGNRQVKPRSRQVHSKVAIYSVSTRRDRSHL